MSNDIIQIIGKQKGPTSIILAGIHGNEKCGVEVLSKILPKMKIETGRVIFGYGNPRAIKENKRFIDINLNRVFNKKLSKKDKESYEYKRAQILMNYLEQADVLLDIHASRTPGSKPFIICGEGAKEIVKYIPIDTVVSGFDKVQPGGADFYMNSIGKIGICIECGYIEDIRSRQTAEQAVFAFLKARGHIKNNIGTCKKSYFSVFDQYYTRTNNFILSKSFSDFEEVLKGQIIGTDGGKQIRARSGGIILFARKCEEIGSEAFLLGKKNNSLA